MSRFGRDLIQLETVNIAGIKYLLVWLVVNRTRHAVNTSQVNYFKTLFGRRSRVSIQSTVFPPNLGELIVKNTGNLRRISYTAKANIAFGFSVFFAGPSEV